MKVVAVLRVLSVDPGRPACEIYLGPAQTGHVTLLETRGQGEQHHVALVLVQFRQQRPGLLRGYPAHPPLGLPVQLHLGRLPDPFPLVACPAQDRADEGQVAVGGRSARLGPLARPEQRSACARAEQAAVVLETQKLALGEQVQELKGELGNARATSDRLDKKIQGLSNLLDKEGATRAIIEREFAVASARRGEQPTAEKKERKQRGEQAAFL